MLVGVRSVWLLALGFAHLASFPCNSRAFGLKPQMSIATKCMCNMRGLGLLVSFASFKFIVPWTL
ncbi:hypothetical protein FKP32DRAFT_1593251 [Trametes sanguinea]|nr:hypothetical protein FKP32DRAFT_1593251 [Trametes sanguinea]